MSRHRTGAILCLALFALALIRTNGEGVATTEAGRYLIEHQDTFVRELDPAEYQRLRAAEVCGFSGHWVLFGLLPGLLLGYSPRLSR